AEQSGAVAPPPAVRPPSETPSSSSTATTTAATLEPAAPSIGGVLDQVEEVPFRTPADSLLVDATRPHEAPMEEFRALRTRLNQMQSLQPIHSVVISSPSPAEGKSITAANLALAQAHLAGNRTLLADFDFRRPIIHSLFHVDRSPGIT